VSADPAEVVRRLVAAFNAFDIDRELHALFGLRMPQLAGVDPLKAARKLATPYEVDDIQWQRAAG